MPQYLDNKPVDLLVASDLVAEYFNDDSLRRSLEQLFTAGVIEVFAQVAAQTLRLYGHRTSFLSSWHRQSSSQWAVLG